MRGVEFLSVWTLHIKIIPHLTPSHLYRFHFVSVSFSSDPLAVEVERGVSLDVVVVPVDAEVAMAARFSFSEGSLMTEEAARPSLMTRGGDT